VEIFCRCLLLNPLLNPLGFDQQIENSQYVPPVFHHPRKNVPQLRLALRLAVPFRQHRWRHFDIPAQSFRGMPAQKQPVEKRRLSLWILQIHRRYSWHELYDRSHREIAVYRKAFARQVVLPVLRYLSINSPLQNPPGAVGGTPSSIDAAPSRYHQYNAPTNSPNLIALRCGKLKQGYIP
jgi:hypothetical protein